MEGVQITSNKQYQAYLSWVDEMFNMKIKPESTQGKKLKTVLLAIKRYEDKHFPILRKTK